MGAQIWKVKKKILEGVGICLWILLLTSKYVPRRATSALHVGSPECLAAVCLKGSSFGWSYGQHQSCSGKVTTVNKLDQRFSKCLQEQNLPAVGLKKESICI